MRAAGVGKDFKENPNLRDNWTDAEGYYSKYCPRNRHRLSGVSRGSRVCRTPALLHYRGVTSAPLRGQHRGDAGQTLRCLWLHGPGRIQQRDPGQGHRQGWPGGGSQDHPKQRAHVSHSCQSSNKHMDVGFINTILSQAEDGFERVGVPQEAE